MKFLRGIRFKIKYLRVEIVGYVIVLIICQDFRWWVCGFNIVVYIIKVSVIFGVFRIQVNFKGYVIVVIFIDFWCVFDLSFEFC